MWWWWCGPLCYTRESVLPRALLHLIRVAEHLGVKLPASPPPLPRPDGGGQPWPCACAHGPKKSTRQRACHQPVQETMPTAELPLFLHCLDQPGHLSLHKDRHVGDSAEHRSCNCGISTVPSQTAPRSLPDLHNQHQPPCQCTATGESLWSLNSETMGSCLCAPTGMLTTLKRNCNCGTSTVMHDNLVQEAAPVEWSRRLAAPCI